MKHLKHFDQHSLLIGATRYYTGRCTAATTDFARRLADAWPDIPPHTQKIIRRDLEDDFKRDDRAREMESEFKPLGADCDRQAWEEVRKAWRNQ